MLSLGAKIRRKCQPDHEQEFMADGFGCLFAEGRLSDSECRNCEDVGVEEEYESDAQPRSYTKLAKRLRVEKSTGS